MASRLIAGTRVIVVSHTIRTQGMLEALQKEFVAVAVKRAERIWMWQMKEVENVVGLVHSRDLSGRNLSHEKQHPPMQSYVLCLGKQPR